MFSEYDVIFNEFIEKIDKIRRYNGYKYFSGKTQGLEKIKFSDFDYPFFADGFKWPFECDEVWLKGEIIIPEKIVGIPVNGSSAVFAHMAACSSRLYVNGEKKVDEKWWVNTDILLSDSLNPNDIFDITICFKKIDGDNFYSLPQIFVERVESVFLKINAFFKTIKFLKRLIALGEITDEKLINIFEDMTARIPISLIRDEKTIEFANYITETEFLLRRFSGYLKKYCSHLIGHAHIDMNWLWDWENTLDTARRTFIQVEKFMDQYPEFCFSQSQAALYKAMEDNCPQVFESMKKMIKDGRWDVIASTWVEGDLNMASGEALIRQSLYAKQYTREKFAVESKVCWCPDTFGHPATYPQILKKCGIDYYYFCRCGKNAPLFYWEGIDGSKVLAFNDPSGYNGVVGADLISRFDRSIKNNKKKEPSAGGFVDALGEYNIKNDLFSYGVGDHGGGPTIRDIKKGLALKNKDTFSQIEFGTTPKFFDKVKAEMKDIPVIKGELNYTWEGCYTTHADIKKYNRQSENQLVTAEIFASIASVFGFNYPLDKIRQAWQDTCFNQFHDILDGSGIHLAYDYSQQLAERAINIATQTTDEATGYISSLISLPQKKKGAIPIVVFNPLSWTREDVLEIALSGLNMDFAGVEDINGNKVTSQVIENKLFFNVKIPPMGYKTYFLCPEDRPEIPSESETKPDTVFENDSYLFELDPATGGIRRLFHKGKNKELIDGLLQGNIFKLYTEQEHGLSSWDIGRIDSVKNLYKNTKIVRTIKGPVVDIVETECVFEKSRINQQIMFFKNQDKIEFRTSLSWRQIGTPKTGIPMLRVSFPLKIMSASTVYEIPFGVVPRPNNGQEAPALKWVDYSDGELGVGLLNDCKYGYNIQGSNIELTLIRSPYEPDLNPDCGDHTFSYCLCPHEGNWQEADMVRRGYELNMPLKPVVLDNNSLVGDERKNLPPEKTFISVDTKNIIISCLKKAEDSRGFIMHAYESEGRESACIIDFGLDIQGMEETNLIEDVIDSDEIVDNKLKCEFGKWEIKSYRFLT